VAAEPVYVVESDGSEVLVLGQGFDREGLVFRVCAGGDVLDEFLLFDS
jgi:hypothetical protein